MKLLEVPFSQGAKARAKNRVMERIAEKPLIAMEKRRPQMVWLRAAAALVLAIGVMAALHHFSGVELKNGLGVAVIHELPDGSTLTLAPQAAVGYNKVSWMLDRELSLQGEAFFDVIPGSAFTVKAPLGEVEVKGTSFSVWARESRLIVHCITGKVEARLPAHTVILHAGSMATTDSETGSWNLMNVDAKASLLPQQSSTLTFENTPIEVVCAELERAFGVQVINRLDPTLRYTGRLNRYRKDESFRVLCTTFGARLVESGGRVTLEP